MQGTSESTWRSQTAAWPTNKRRASGEQAASKRAELLARIAEAVNTVRPAGGRAG